MYQPSAYPASFLIKQSLFAIFVAWFCCSLVLISTEPKFFDVNYSKVQLEEQAPDEDSYNIKTPLFKKVLMGYDYLGEKISMILKKVAEFIHLITKDLKYSGFMISNMILFIPFFVSFCAVMSLSSSISPEKVVLVSVVNSALLIFTIIFNVFAGIYYGYESIQTTPLQVASYALLNTVIFFLSFSVFSFLWSFKKSK